MFTYSDTYNTVQRALYNRLEELSEDNNNKNHLVLYTMFKNHKIELKNITTFGVYQTWADNTHMIKRTVFEIPKKLIKEQAQAYNNGDTKQLLHTINTMIKYAIQL